MKHIIERTVDQKIQIGNNITLTLVKVINDNHIRIGVEAPQNIRIVRDEVVHPTTKQLIKQKGGKIAQRKKR